MTGVDPCAHCEEMMQPYLDGALSDAEVEQAKHHLEQCSWCAKRYHFEERDRKSTRLNSSH